MHDLTPERIAKLRKLAEQASSGPWRVETGKYTGRDWLIGTSGFDDLTYHVTTDRVHASELGGDAKSDAEHIAAFDPLTTLTLLNALQAVKAERDALKAQVEALREAIEPIRSVGSRMSNLCFNVRQQEILYVQDKQRMDELYREWDAANRVLHTVLASAESEGR